MDVVAESIASNLHIAVSNQLSPQKNGVCRAKSLPPMKTTSKATALYKRLVLTCSMYVVYYSMGQNSGLLGPTLVHLEYLFQTTTSQISQVVMWLSVGYVIGALVCIVVFDKLNHELQFSFWAILCGICTTLIPWMPSVYGYFAMVSFQFMAHGTLYAGGQVYMLSLWRESKLKRPVVQATHLMWSFGAFVCPFLAIPFLVELNPSILLSINAGDLTNSSEYPLNVSVDNISKPGFIEGVYKVRYLYSIVGSIDMLGGVFFLIGFLMLGPKLGPISYNTISHDVEVTRHSEGRIFLATDSKNIKLIKVVIFGVMLLIVPMYFWHETVIYSYITAFSVKGLHWTSERGAMLTSIFFGCLGLGRVAGVFISRVLSPAKVLIINMFFTNIGLFLLYFAYHCDVIVFAGTAIAGFFMATTFPSLILWLSEFIVFNGFVSGMFMVVGSVGTIIVAPLVGCLFETYTPMWVVYISSGSAVVCFVLFILLIFLGKLFSRYKSITVKNDVAEQLNSMNKV